MSIRSQLEVRAESEYVDIVMQALQADADVAGVLTALSDFDSSASVKGHRYKQALLSFMQTNRHTQVQNTMLNDAITALGV